MQRSCELEILEYGRVPEPEAARVYRDLTRIHRWLGDTASLVSAVRRDPLPVRRILDIGCGTGGVLRDLRKQLPVDVVGVDVNPLGCGDEPFSILQADAVSDPLPRADIAVSLCLGHHLSECELVKLIRNVGRYCRRFILLDLVRHPLPLALFRLFVAPFISPIAAADGQVSVRRAYTPLELTAIARDAVAGSTARFHHSIAPLYVRQTLDVTYRA
jgi:SAM-dependent methyltransferase